MANLVIASCNFYVSGAPLARETDFGDGTFLDAQIEMVGNILRECQAFCACPGGEIASDGRGVSRLFDMIVSLESRYGAGPKTQKSSKAVTVAQQVDPDKVSVPPVAGLLDGAQLMCPERAKVFADLQQILRDPDLAPEQPARSCHMIDAKLEIDFVRDLAKRELVELIPESEVATHPRTGKVLRGGFFGVPHKVGKQRLIFDRRPQNELEEDLSSLWLWLPHGSQFCEWVLPPDSGVRGSCDDLSCWFYQLRHKASWWRRQACSRRLRGEDFVDLGARPGVHYRACLRVVAMGDRNGVPFAQEAHEFMLKAAGLLDGHCTLRYGASAPLGPSWEGAYVDDHVFAQELGLERLRCQPGVCDCAFCAVDSGELPDVVAVRALEATYARHGAARAVEKEVRHATDFTAWGTRVEGRRGRVSVDIEKRVKVARLTYAVARRGSCTQNVLRSLAGFLVHPLMHRRSLMSSLSAIYRLIDTMSPVGETSLLPAVVDELLCGCLLLCFAFTDIRSPVCPTVSATDATCSKGGAARALVPPSLARALYRRGEQRGEHGILRWSDVDIACRPTSMQEPEARIDDLIQSLPWEAPQQWKFCEIHHINIQELAAVVLELEHRILNGLKQCRVVICIDSRVVVGAIGKGRSSSVRLNAYLRRLCALSIGARVDIRVLWVATHANPADAPSRDRALPERGARPAWAEKFWRTAPELGSKPRPQFAAASSGRDLPPKLGARRRSAAGVAVPFNNRSSWERPTCREYYSGRGRLSEMLRERGFDTVEIEAFGADGGFDVNKDMSQGDLVKQECEDIAAGKVAFAHIGIVCSSWCAMSMQYNGGTRTRSNPFGDLSLARERLGNQQLIAAEQLIDCLNTHSIPWTLENPHDSFIWLTQQLGNYIATPFCRLALFDQCMYKLRPPDQEFYPDKDLRVRKRTKILGSLPGLESLNILCDRKHTHVAAFGSVRIHGKRIVRAAAAGAYPFPLCRKIADIVLAYLP